ncbi:MAG: histidine phosphatase family protein [Alphaproteobacteria bacterium]|nr:histidine phosphatase family protein [Alphaproteobacteria bacterium]
MLNHAKYLLFISLTVFSTLISHALATKQLTDVIRRSSLAYHSVDKPLPWLISPVHTERGIFKANDMVVSLHPSQSPLLGRLLITTEYKQWEDFSWHKFQEVFRASTLMLTKVLYPRDPRMQPRHDNQLFNLMGYERDEGIVFEICPRLPADRALLYMNFEGKDPSPGKPLKPSDLEFSPKIDEQLIQILLDDLRKSSDEDVLKLYRQNGPFPEPQQCEVCHLAKNSSSIFFHDRQDGFSLALDPRSQGSNPGRAFIETYKHYPSLSYLPSSMMGSLGRMIIAYLKTLEQVEGRRPLVDIQSLMNLKGDITPHFHLHLIPNRGWTYYDFSQNRHLNPEEMESKLEQYKATVKPEYQLQLIKLGLPLKHFILIRHGETDENRAKIIQGQTDTRLNAKGIEQASQLYRFLCQNDIQVADIFCSPLSRATETAEILSESLGLGNWKIFLHDGLMERSFGKSEGTPNISGDLATVDHEDAEDKHVFQDRCVKALFDILNIRDYSCKGTPIIVTHGGVVKSISSYLGIDLGGVSQNAVPMVFSPPDIISDVWKLEYLQ